MYCSLVEGMIFFISKGMMIKKNFLIRGGQRVTVVFSWPSVFGVFFVFLNCGFDLGCDLIIRYLCSILFFFF